MYKRQEQYKNGKVFVIGGDQVASEYDTTELDFKYEHPEATRQFVQSHNLQKLNLLFITDAQRDNLINSTEYIGKRASVLVKEAVEVRDLLKANRIYIELPALQWFIGRYSLE